jgi:collagen type III alpha
MAAVVEQKVEQKPDPAAKFGSQVDEQIAQATSRIRVHDLTLGGLTLAAMVAVYATTMILLDKYLNLAEWVRQLALAGFLAACAGVAYLLIARPLLKRINPLYAAARVEETIDDAKNSVTGYVEAQEEGNVHAAVKAAMSARAAKAVGEADVNLAVNHRSLLVAGGVFVVFLLALGVLFFIFRPTQFTSLAGRTFLPFSSAPIATRTQLTLLKPEQPEPTITTGQTITVAVHVGGKVPAKTDATRVRVLLRHVPTDPNYEEIPMVEGDTTRDWQVKIPEYLVQNGFWYKVAAGDAETPEYRVTVRSLPLFTDFDATYEYPKYTRKPNDKANDPNVRGVRGTKVTLVARTNREVKEGLLKFEAAGLAPVAGKPAADKPDSLVFQFAITEATRYRLYMTTTAGEQNTDPPPFLVLLDSDQPPRVEITTPEEPETRTPANGQLAVDGTVGVDFGIDKVRLRMRHAGRDLAPVPYMGGKSFLRDKDKTWPTDLAYKDSADLTKLKYADNAPFAPKEGDLIEFWLEAIDNCTETKPVAGWGEKPQPGNVGSSQVYKLTLTAPRTAEEEKKQLDQNKEERKNNEQQHNAAQQKKLDNENREPPKPDPTKQPQAQPDQKDPKEGDGKADTKDTKDGKNGKPGDQPPPKAKDDGKKGGDSDSGMGGNTDPKGGPKPPDTPPKPDNTKKGGPNDKGMADPNGMGNAGGMTDPKMNQGGKPPEGKDGEPKSPSNPPMGGMPNTGMGGGMNPPTEAPMPKTPDEKELERKIRQAEEELNKNRGEGGDAKQNPTPRPEDRADPARQKPQPMGGGQDAAQPKDAPKPGPMTPMGGDKGGAAESKHQGNLQQPTDPNPEPKPEPKGDTPDKPKHEPLGGSAGKDKPVPEPKKGENPAEPKDAKQDPASGAQGKPATEKKDPAAGPDGQPKDPTANAGAPKPNPENDRGTDKNPPKGAPAGDTQPKTDPDAAGVKPERAPESGQPKPMPNGAGDKTPADSGGKEPPKTPMNPADPMGGASGTKPDGMKPMGGTGAAGEDKAVEPGMDKELPKNPAQGGGKSENPKLDPKQIEDIKEAAKGLNDPDPAKQQAARDKLDKMVGEANRKAIEDFQKNQKEDLDKLQKDLDSKDEATREAAKKRLEGLQKKGDDIAKDENAKKGGKDQDGKGRELSEAEIEELMKKLPDLASDDPEKRKAAEKAFDEKLGKETREQLQKEIEKRKKEIEKFDPEKLNDLKDKVAREAKTGGGSDNTPPKPATEADPRNKAKAAQLQLEQFEKERFGTLPDRLKWTPEQYKEFLDQVANRTKKLEVEAEKFAEAKRAELGKPTIATADGGKVGDRDHVVSPGVTNSGPSFAPPGFDKAREKFFEAAKKLGENK